MEPLNDQELNQLLRQWRASEAPARLAENVLPRNMWWRWLWAGSIRIPVPVGIAVAAALGLWVFWANRAAEPRPRQVEVVSLSEFQPVQQLEPRIIRSSYEENR